MKILTVIPFHKGDATLALQLLQFMQQLDKGKELSSRHVLLAFDQTVPDDVVQGIQAVAKDTFKVVRKMQVQIPDDRQGWPKGPNYMFQAVAQQMKETSKLPWLWLEPDCTPLAANWLVMLEEEYEASPKLFMGAMIKGIAGRKEVSHMSGVGIYPPNALDYVSNAAVFDTAFDLALADPILPRMQNTPLIQHNWGTNENPPTFVPERNLTMPKEVCDLKLISPKAVLFHRCKDGSLMKSISEPPKVAKPPVPANMPPGVTFQGR